MRACVITPTRLHGGLDVNSASLAAQNWPMNDLMWVVIDEWYAEREEEVGPHLAKLPFHVVYEPGPPKRPGCWNNLASAYNKAVAHGVTWDADFYVSMQDYFWIPENGLQLFAELAVEYPDDIYSGLASLSYDPYPDEVADLEGGWTIFAEPWTYSKPVDLKWRDVRERHGFGHPFVWDATNWEANWAAFPRSVVEAGIRWDPEYERGVAYENQWFAARCIHEHGSRVWIDPRNHAIGLPHKAYYPEIEQRELAENNREWHEARIRERGWGT